MLTLDDIHERDRKRAEFLASELVSSEKQYASFWFHRYTSAILVGSFWFQKPKGQNIGRWEETNWGWQQYIVDCPRFLQIDTIVVKNNWRVEDIRSEVKNLINLNTEIICNQSEYLKGILAGLPSIKLVDLPFQEHERTAFLEDTKNLISGEKIKIDLSESNEFIMNALMMFTQELTGILTIERYVACEKPNLVLTATQRPF